MNRTRTRYNFKHSQLITVSNYLSTVEADALFEHCNNELKLLEKPPIMIHGKECRQQRDVGFFSDNSKGYHYSHRMMESQPMTETLQSILDRINKEHKATFNGILINRYNNGTEYVSKHQDSEDKLEANGEVIAITLFDKHDATRKFRIRSRKNKILIDIPTEHGQKLVMGKGFQNKSTGYYHEIPVEKKVDCVRISLTFRCHKE